MAPQETNNKLGECRPEGHVTHPRNRGWWRRAVDREEWRESSSERGQGPDGTVTLYIWLDGQGASCHKTTNMRQFACT